jgi:hypothetical protein
MSSLHARGPAPVWDVPLPVQQARKYDQLYVVDKDGHDVLIVSSRVLTTQTHWWRGRTHFCSERADKPCDLDHRETGRPRFAGWIACCFPGHKKVFMLRLTEAAFRHEPRLLGLEGHLRGRLLRVWREAPFEWCEMFADLSPAAPVESLPAEPDLRLAIAHMVYADDRHDRQAKNNEGPFKRAVISAQRKAAEAAKQKGATHGART